MPWCPTDRGPRADRRARRARSRLAVAAFAGVVAAFVCVTAQAENKSYGYEDDPIRVGGKALEEGRLNDAREQFQEAIDNEWKTDRARFGMGEVLRRQGKYAEAETFYREALAERAQSKSRTTYAEANAGLGLTLYFLNRPADARREIETALDLEKGLWAANYGMARLLIDEKKYAEALPYLDRGKGLTGALQFEDQYLFGLALAQVGLGEMTEAEKNALRALTLNPRVPEYGVLVAEVLTARGAPTMAIDAYERALALLPPADVTPEIHQNLAALYETQRQFNDALRHYRDAVQIDSTFAPAYKSAARLYALGNQNDWAAQFYLRYTELAPDDPEGWFGQADAFINLNSNRRALEAAEKAYALDSEDPRIRLALARATYLTNDLVRSERLYAAVADTALYKAADYVRLGQIALSYRRFERADTLLTQALDMDSTNAEAYAAMGKLFLARLQPDSAVAWYEEAIALNPNSALSRINLGIALLQLKRVPEATRVLREAVTLHPDVVPARVFLGQALVMGDSLSAALEEYTRAIEIDPNSAGALRGAGFVYLKRTDYASAEKVLRKATELDPTNADGWVSLGSALAGLNRIDEAIAAFEKALEISPNHSGALKALESLKKAKEAASK